MSTATDSKQGPNKAVWYGVGSVFLLFLVVWTAMGKMDSPFTGQGLGLWLAAFLSLCVMSFLYDDNPFYKFSEHLFIGISAAYYMVLGVWDQLIRNLMTKLWPELVSSMGWVAEVDTNVALGTRLWMGVLPAIFGIMLIWRLAPKGGWIARWPLAVIVGWAAGTNLVRYLVSDFTKQIEPNFMPLLVIDADGVNWIATISALVLVLGLLAALIYFFFSVEHKGAFGHASRIGIWILMITFGAAFAYTVMGRIALLVGRMEFLFIDWMKLFGGGG